jgi:hypothetical protein
MWYYEFNHQPVGPVNEETMAELLRAGTINALTLVWHEGFPNWKHLAETKLNDLNRNVVSSVSLGMPALSPQITPSMGTAVNSRPPSVKPASLKNLFTWWTVFMVLTLIYQVFSGFLPTDGAMIAVSCIAEIVIITYAVLQFILLYRFWKIDQDGFASITPGKAVGYLFIPIFNIYWIFRVYCGLANDQNRYIARHFDSQPGVEVRKSHPFISLLFLLFSFVGSIIMYVIIFTKMAPSLMNNLNTPVMNTIMAQFSIPIMIFTLITMGLSFTMYYDFYQTALDIVETESAQK